MGLRIFILLGCCFTQVLSETSYSGWRLFAISVNVFLIVHPGKWTWNIVTETWKMIFLFNYIGVFRCSMLIFRGVLSSTPVITCNEIPVHLCHCETSLDMLMVQKSGEPPPEIETKNPVPGDSKWPFDSLVGVHLTFPNGHKKPSPKGHKELPGK